MDIVERLRGSWIVSSVMTEAADEIERLRFKVAEMAHGYDMACNSGVAGSGIQRVCNLCLGEKYRNGVLTTIAVEYVHEGGFRSWARVLCPRCSGTGVEPEC